MSGTWHPVPSLLWTPLKNASHSSSTSRTSPSGLGRTSRRPQFEFGPIADALAERGRVVVRRAYADWVMFEDDRRMLAQHQVELIEIPQRIGSTRKNAADIKMAVDAVELSFERDYITTFVLGTGDSDFTPLVHKLRELNRRVIGIGLRGSTSPLLAAVLRRVPLLRVAAGPRPAPAPGAARAKPRQGGTEETPAAVVETPEDLADLERVVTQTLSGLQQIRRRGGARLRR